MLQESVMIESYSFTWYKRAWNLTRAKHNL